MLPDKVYARYYVEECDDCSDGEINRADDYPDWAECGGCQCNMCEDCTENKRCVVCDEKHWNGNGDYEGMEPAMCDSCADHCEKCNISFHRQCKAEHLTECNRESRAIRALAKADGTIRDKKQELEMAKRHVESIKTELRAAKRRKNEAQEELKNL